MNHITEILTNQLVSNNIINHNLKEEYKYALDKIIEKTVSYSLLFIISMYFNMLIPTFIFLLCFCSLRGCTGGFHFNTFTMCMISTIIVHIVFIKSIYPWLYDNSKYLPYLLIISALIILGIGAINHPNIDWDKNEIKEANKAAKALLFLQVVCIYLCIELNINKTFLIFAIFGVTLCAISMIIAKILKQEVRS